MYTQYSVFIVNVVNVSFGLICRYLVLHGVYVGYEYIQVLRNTVQHEMS